MAKPTPKPELAQRRVALRLPAAVYDAMLAVADDEMRTLNATAVVLLTEALTARGVLERPAKRARKA